MRPKHLPLLLSLALGAAACGSPEVTIRDAGGDAVAFVVNAADVEGNRGTGVGLTLDADGNPHLSYLGFEAKPVPGEAPPAPVFGAPVPPAVVHAHLTGGLWTRSTVAQEQGVLPMRFNRFTGLEVRGDTTAIALDGEGVHHVVWSGSDGISYSNNADGAFPEDPTLAIPTRGATGVSLVLDPAGTPGVAYYDAGGLKAATVIGGQWVVEDVAPGAAPSGPATTAIGAMDGEPAIAFSDAGGVFLARRTAEAWIIEVADPGGESGVSMSIDADGNPHLAYYTQGGEVGHAHSIAGAGWETSRVARGADPQTTTAIAVDAEGVHHVAWETGKGLAYANNAEGSFGEIEVSGTETGVRPRLAAGAGLLYLAWYEAAGGHLMVGVGGAEEEQFLAAPPPSPAPTEEPTDQPTGPPPCEPEGTELSIVAPPGASGSGFDIDCLAVSAGEGFTVDFPNDDSVAHNWALYTDSTAAEQLGGGTVQEPIQPGESFTYAEEAIDEAGLYFFRCDFHPTTMTGDFVVQ